MAIFGWFVLFLGTLWIGRQTYGVLMFSMGFTGRIAGEFWLFLAITCACCYLLWRFMPFSVTLT